MSNVEYLLRVRHALDGSFTASLRQFAPTGHPEVRAVIGPVVEGQGANAQAAMVSAVANAHIQCVPSASAGRYPDA